MASRSLRPLLFLIRARRGIHEGRIFCSSLLLPPLPRLDPTIARSTPRLRKRICFNRRRCSGRASGWSARSVELGWCSRLGIARPLGWPKKLPQPSRREAPAHSAGPPNQRCMGSCGPGSPGHNRAEDTSCQTSSLGRLLCLGGTPKDLRLHTSGQVRGLPPLLDADVPCRLHRCFVKTGGGSRREVRVTGLKIEESNNF